jgi:hypothetical protein
MNTPADDRAEKSFQMWNPFLQRLQYVVWPVKRDLINREWRG